jgi:hypothetical protein
MKTIKNKQMKKALIGIPLLNYFLNAFTQSQIKTEYKNFHIQIIRIKIENSINLSRKDEVIESDWARLVEKNANAMSSPFIVINELTGDQYP